MIDRALSTKTASQPTCTAKTFDTARRDGVQTAGAKDSTTFLSFSNSVSAQSLGNCYMLYSLNGRYASILSIVSSTRGQN